MGWQHKHLWVNKCVLQLMMTLYMSKCMYGQVLVLPIQHLVRLAADDDFGIQSKSGINKTCQCECKSYHKCKEDYSCTPST